MKGHMGKNPTRQKKIRPRRTPFGRRAYAARKQAGLTQTRLAEIIGVTQTAIYKLENLAREGSSFTVQIAECCNVNPLWLATGKGVKGIDKSAMSTDAVIVGLAWQHLKTEELRMRYCRDILSAALDLMLPGTTIYRQAKRLHAQVTRNEKTSLNAST